MVVCAEPSGELPRDSDGLISFRIRQVADTSFCLVLIPIYTRIPGSKVSLDKMVSAQV